MSGQHSSGEQVELGATIHGRLQRRHPVDLTLQYNGLSESDLDTPFDPGSLHLPNPTPLREIVAYLQETYCRTIGAEYMHIQDAAKRRWLQERMEPVRNHPRFTHEQKLIVLRSLIEADGFESFPHNGC